MTEYRHGGDVYRNREILLDFSINLNPLGMPEFIRNAAIRGVMESSRYPDSSCMALRDRVSSYYNVPGEALIFGNGAAELIFGIVRAVKPKRAVIPAPAFSEYERALRAQGTEISCFRLKEENSFGMPEREYLEFLMKERPDMIFLCSPANPVGTLIKKEQRDRILAFCRKQEIFVVADECFLDLTDAGEEESAVADVRGGMKNLFVIQALTKSFSMAGLRLGYGFCKDSGVLAAMRASVQPWNVSVVAQEAGVAAFGPERMPYLSRTRDFLRTEREYLKGRLKSMGFAVYDSDANFLLFRDRAEREERQLYESLRKRGILIRCCDDYQELDGRYYRICVKQREENDLLLKYMQEYI